MRRNINEQMRTINEIIIHCSATPEGRDFTAADIDRMHRTRGWSSIGYHYVIRLDGTVESGRPEERPGAHCYGRNAHSIGVCYIGGVDRNNKPKDTRTAAQKASLVKVVRSLLDRYPGASVHGHNEYAAKDCPSFDVQRWRKEEGL